MAASGICMRVRTRYRPGSSRRWYHGNAEPRPLAVVKSDEVLRQKHGTVTVAHLQPKLDGWRVIADVKLGRMFTRGERMLGSENSPGLSLIRHALFQMRPSPHFRYVDCELVHSDGRDSIRNAIEKEATGAMCLHIFDCVLKDECFSSRLGALHTWAAPCKPPVQLVQTRTLGEMAVGSPDLEEQLNEAQQQYQRGGFEGAILRLDDALGDGGGYKLAGLRSVNASKWRVGQEDEFEIKFLEEAAPKGSGLLGKVRCVREGEGKRKYFTVLVDGN